MSRLHVAPPVFGRRHRAPRLVLLLLLGILSGCGTSAEERAGQYDRKLRAYQRCVYSQIVGVNTRDGELTRHERERIEEQMKAQSEDCVEPKKP